MDAVACGGGLRGVCRITDAVGTASVRWTVTTIHSILVGQGARNNADDIWVSRTSDLVFETDKEYDSCRFEASPQQIRAVRIDP